MKKTKSKTNIKEQNNINIKQKISNNYYVFDSTHEIQELAKYLKVSSAQLIKKLLNLGFNKNIHDILDKETVTLLCQEFNFKIVDKKEIKRVEKSNIKVKKDDLGFKKRPPIITIMGHVNHGKTTLLDTIRKTRLVDKEIGGITQHIGAYQTKHQDNLITFIDTPGHEIFSQMRERGVQFTDICVLILAADDGVKPQTIEALKHAQDAKVPIIVALNKIDKPHINIEPIMSELANFDLLPENWGGSTPYVEISALKNIGIDKLLEIILLISEIENYQAETKIAAEGHVLESNLDKSRGPMATFIIKKGILKVGDIISVGNTYGRVRSIENDFKKSLKEAFPSQPVKISGLKNVPSVGDMFVVVKDEITAKKTSSQTKQTQQENIEVDNKFLLLENFLSNEESVEIKYLNIILKTDYQGSSEAIKSILEKLVVKDIKIKFIKIGVGDISESDIHLGQSNSSLIIGFNVNVNAVVKNLAKIKDVKINLYNIIYRISEDVEKKMKNLLAVVFKEQKIGQAEVRKIFNIHKIGTIAGCYCIDGIIYNDSLLKIIRNKEIIHKGKVISLKRLKDNILHSSKGQECGILVENFNDFMIGDIIESYKIGKVDN